MNKKFRMYAVFLALFAPFLTGCICTAFTDKRLNEKARYDTFNPTAVYRRDTPVSFALAGTRQTQSESLRGLFLIIPDEVLARAHVGAAQAVSLEDIEKMYEGLYLVQKTPSGIPPEYAPVAILPRNRLAIAVEQPHRPAGAWLGYLLPFAIIADVATFPFQAIYVAAGGDPGWTF